VDENRLRQFAVSRENMSQLFCAERRSFVVCDRNMPDLEAGRAVNVDEGAVGVEAEMLIGEKANDGRHAG
jgi:hypothetical protein